jgi:hypothetical protein
MNPGFTRFGSLAAAGSHRYGVTSIALEVTESASVSLTLCEAMTFNCEIPLLALTL